MIKIICDKQSEFVWVKTALDAGALNNVEFAKLSEKFPENTKKEVSCEMKTAFDLSVEHENDLLGGREASILELLNFSYILGSAENEEEIKAAMDGSTFNKMLEEHRRTIEEQSMKEPEG